jgi:AcrR family transcriptional regulator
MEKVDKKDQIIKAAIDLFAEKGFEGTSIRELAASADVNLAMVNYYFGSKEKLFEAMVEQKANSTLAQLEEIEKSAAGEMEKIEAIIESYVDRFINHHKFNRVMHHELMLRQREALHENIAALFARNRNIMKRIIESGVKKKLFKKVDPELTMATMVGTINQVLLSKPMCTLLVEKGQDFDPYTDAAFKKRLLTHLKQLMRSHLLLSE